jgi:hypothetical protein
MEWCREYQDCRPVYSVKVKVAPELSHKLSMYLGETVRYEILETEQDNEPGWMVVNISFEKFFRAPECILSLGRAGEVLEPETLKLSDIVYAKQIIDFYQIKSGL